MLHLRKTHSANKTLVPFTLVDLGETKGARPVLAEFLDRF